MPSNTSASAISPALVTQKAVQRLPRWALLLFCAAYVLPGLLGRDPWKNEDIASFGHMWSLALGQAPWLHPHVGGVLPTSGGILPYWLGGASIWLLSPWVDPSVAARLPFALLLASTLSLTWYATYHLALTKAAQPLQLAFGGEAQPADYARAVADGALLALIASLGLLQLGHETTPELLQLTGGTLFLYSLAACATRVTQSRMAALLSLATLAVSGSPTIALGLGAVGWLVCQRSSVERVRAHAPWMLAALCLSTILASALSQLGLAGWAMRLSPAWAFQPALQLLTWFTWPVLPMAGLTLWHWRRQALRRHIAAPALVALVSIVASLAMGANERALLGALPGLAVLAAFALPILQRSLGAAIDWFSVLFFTVLSAALWLVYAAMHTGHPLDLAANVARKVPGFHAHFSILALCLAVIATLLWLGLVRWRTARQTHALWKSLVLPAGGVAMCWLLFMTLWLPLLDQARSYRLLMGRLSNSLQHADCVYAPDAPVGLLTAMEYFAGRRVKGLNLGLEASTAPCNTLVLSLAATEKPPQAPGWTLSARYNQRSANSEQIVVYHRPTAP